MANDPEQAGQEYIGSPIVIAVLVLTIVSIVIGIKQGKQILGGSAPPVGGRLAPLMFLLAVTAYVAIAVWDAWQINVLRDKIFPVTIGIVTLTACAILILRMGRAPASDPVFADLEAGEEDGNAAHGLWGTLGWFGALLILASLVGFILALTAFFILFLRERAGCSWRQTLILTGAALALMSTLGGVLGRDFPPGLLQDYVDLPWPLT